MAVTTNVQAVIMGREDWREHDALLTLYTREFGKVEAVAKGLRKRESKLAPHLEPLAVAEIFLITGRGKPLVAGSIVEDGYPNIRQDLDRLSTTGALLRVVDVMTPLEAGDDRVFDLLMDSLGAVAANHLTAPQRLLLPHLVAWKLLIFSGYRPELKHCLRCQRRSITAEVHLHPRRGGTIHRTCLGNDQAPSIAVSPAALKGLHYMVEAPITDTLRLRGEAAAFAEIQTAVAALVAERFELALPV